MKDDFDIYLDKVRAELHEKSKHMTNSEFTHYINENGRKIARQYNLKVLRASDLQKR